MKNRISLTLDPTLTRCAKAEARRRGISVSGWVEQLLMAEVARTAGAGEAKSSFATRWEGKLRLRKGEEARRARLMQKYVDAR